MIVSPAGAAVSGWWLPVYSLPALSASDALLLCAHACLGALPLAEASLRSPSAAGEVLLLLAAVLFSRLRAARTPLAFERRCWFQAAGSARAFGVTPAGKAALQPRWETLQAELTADSAAVLKRHEGLHAAQLDPQCRAS